MSTPAAVCLMHDMPHRAGIMVSIAWRCRPEGAVSVHGHFDACCRPTPNQSLQPHDTDRLDWHCWGNASVR